MGAAAVLRRSLLVWGWGHIALGDIRGWLLVPLQPLAIAGVGFAAWQLIDGTRWLAVFLPLVVLLAFWIGQAVHAHGRALALGAAPGGELQLAWFLPVLLAVVSAFWLVAGRHGSPTAPVEAFMAAWEANRPDLAVGLFSDDRPPEAVLEAIWDDWRIALAAAVEQGRATYGPASGLDPSHPFRSLRVTQTRPTAFTVELVRSESYQTTLFGFIPTAGQRTVVVAPVLWIEVTENPVKGLLPSSVWRIHAMGPTTRG